MLIRDIMTTNVITASSSASLADARRIMDAHHVKRLPIVDRGRLVGVVSRSGLEKSGPSRLTTFSMHELAYLTARISVKDIMKRELVTVSPEVTVEKAVALAQSEKVGALLVLEKGRLVGIATTNDFFYKIANPILGIGQPGTRITVRGWDGLAGLQTVLGIVGLSGAEIAVMYATPHSAFGPDSVSLHLKTADPRPLIDELRRAGFEVEVSAHSTDLQEAAGEMADESAGVAAAV